MAERAPAMKTLVDLLEQSRHLHADRPALALRGHDQRLQWTYAEFGERVDRFAALLRDRGIGQGDRVAIWAASQPWWPAAFFGCLKVGAVVVPLDVRGSADFARRIVERTTASALVIGPEQAKSLGEVATLMLPIGDLESLAASLAAPDHAATIVGADDLAEIVFTSGTTGDPKGVMISHRNLVSNVKSFEVHLPGEPRYRLLSLLPLSHLFEQTVGLCYPILAGASVTYVQTLQPSTIFEAIQKESITLVLAVPQVLALFFQAIEREAIRSGQERPWRFAHRLAPLVPFGLRRHLFKTVHQKLGGQFEIFVSGGAYLDPVLAAKWERMGVKVLQGYGLTECAPAVAATSLWRRKLDSVGVPLECCEVRLAEDGEILVRGANVTAGYWQNPEATAAAFEGEWYKTGDLGYLDREGLLYLKGRKKDLIVLGNGMNVYPEDVENAIVLQPGAKDAVVTGLTSPDGDVTVHAVLLLDDLSRAGDIVKAANRKLAGHQRIQSHSVWPETDFPRTPTMKTKRNLVVDTLLAERQSRSP